MIRERHLGPDHPHVVADMAALVAILEGLGRYEESLPLYTSALAIFETIYGHERYEIAVNLNNLAAMAWHLGEWERSEALYQQTLALKRRLLGEEHPDKEYQRLAVKGGLLLVPFATAYSLLYSLALQISIGDDELGSVL